MGGGHKVTVRAERQRVEGGRPLRGHATSGGQETNRRPPARRRAEPRADGQRDEMVPLSVSKRDGWR